MIETLCPDCGEWSSQWRETEVGCEDCGTHQAAECPKCETIFDLVFETLEERTDKVLRDKNG